MIRKIIKYIRSNSAWSEKEEVIVKLILTTSVSDWRQIILEGKLPSRPQSIYDPINGGQILIKAAAIR